MNNEGKWILITGVDGNVGSFVAQKFKSLGWKVVGLDIKLEHELEKAKFIDAYISCDVRDRSNFNGIVHQIETTYGDIEVLFTAAGISIDQNFEDTSIETWKDCLNTWLGGSINACAAVAPLMVKRKRGRIVILSPDYSKTKSGHILDATAAGTLHGFAKSFGVEIAQDNVMINVLSANVPFDLDAIASTVRYLAEKGDYVTAQVISVRGEE